MLKSNLNQINKKDNIDKIKKLKNFSIKGLGIEKKIKNDIKNNFNMKIINGLKGVSLFTLVVIGSIGMINGVELNNNKILSNINLQDKDISTYKFNLITLNQNENQFLLGGIDKREEINKEYESLLEISDSIQSYKTNFGNFNYSLIKTKNGYIVYTQKLSNKNINNENIKILSKKIKEDINKFGNNNIKIISVLPPKDLFLVFNTIYSKYGLNTKEIKEIFLNSLLKVNKTNGEFKILFYLDENKINSTPRYLKIINIIKKYYGNNVYINDYNNIKEKFIDSLNEYIDIKLNYN